MRNREMYNSSGCLDMTAYIALRNIERKERFEHKGIKATMIKESRQKNIPQAYNSRKDEGCR